MKIASDSFLEFDGIERKRFELFPNLFIGSTKDKSTIQSIMLVMNMIKR